MYVAKESWAADCNVSSDRLFVAHLMVEKFSWFTFDTQIRIKSEKEKLSPYSN